MAQEMVKIEYRYSLNNKRKSGSVEVRLRTVEPEESWRSMATEAVYQAIAEAEPDYIVTGEDGKPYYSGNYSEYDQTGVVLDLYIELPGKIANPEQAAIHRRKTD